MNVILTRKQTDVLELLVHGFTNRQIAQILKLSLRTVEGIRARIFSKMKIRGLAECIALAITNGIVTYCPDKFEELKLMYC